MISATEQSDLETRRPIRTFWMRHPWATLLVACGALGVGGYHLGIALALWYDSTASGVLGTLWALPVAALICVAWSRFVPWSRGVRWAKKCLLFLGALGLLAVSCAPESKFLPYPYVDTNFVPGFDRSSFDRLHPGMSAAEVEAIAGVPRSRGPRTWGYMLPGHPDQVWVYSSDGGWIGDYAWRSYEVGFRNGVVVTVSTAWRYD